VSLVCSHAICTCIFSHFTHSLGVFWLPWICISRSCIFYFPDQVFGEHHTYCGSPEFLFDWSSSLGISSCFLLFSFLHWFSIYWTRWLFYSIIHRI